MNPDLHLPSRAIKQRRRKSKMSEKSKRSPKSNELPKLDELKGELRRERYKRRFRRVLRKTVDALIVVAAIAAIIATLVLPVLEIAGTSMEPNLNDGDVVLLVKTDKLETGDLCAFYYSNKILIKRVIGTPGDYIWIESDGTVFLNGEPLDEPYVQKKALGQCDLEFPYQVPESSYFLVGDQRDISVDSRNTAVGCIQQDQIEGKIVFCVWPLKDFGSIG